MNKAPENPLLQQLCALIGIEDQYRDGLGNLIKASPESVREILNALGFPTNNENQLEHAISVLANQKLFSTLPEHYFIEQENARPSIPLCLPSDVIGELDWQINLASGDIIADTQSIEKLQVLSKYQTKNHSYTLYQLALPKLPLGTHKITTVINQNTYRCQIFSTPQRCYMPFNSDSEKIWGLAVQLYSLRSNQNWGIGDFTDLVTVIELAAQQGASFVGLNPLHALYYSNPSHISPYSPNSRCFLNTLYIDVASVPLFNQDLATQSLVSSNDFQRELTRVRESELVDYEKVAQLKYRALTLLYQAFKRLQESDASNAMVKDFQSFKQRGGKLLAEYATYEALYRHFRQDNNNAWGWPDWPTAYHQPTTTAVKNFQHAYRDDIDYFIYLQWLADSQLMDAKQSAKSEGLSIGLYLDIAVGSDRCGADVWSNQSLHLCNVSIGAPADELNLLGQNWGLPPLNPIALDKQNFKYIQSLLTYTMRYAGAVRIDHVLGLFRQYWIPKHAINNQGNYIRFPFDKLLQLVVLESQRHQCLVIGEDLGTVPDGFTEKIQSKGLLSYAVLVFERWSSGLFKRPSAYSQHSIVASSTHDTATLCGWWQDQDLVWRKKLNQFPSKEIEMVERERRAEDRKRLIAALDDANVFDDNPISIEKDTDKAITKAVLALLARSASQLQVLPIEDALRLIDPVNIPGTIDQHPNWQRKLPMTLNSLSNCTAFIESTKIIDQNRQR